MATVLVLGAGNIGGTLGRKWVQAGHQITFGVRDPRGESAEELRDGTGSSVRSIDDLDVTLASVDAVVFAIPGTAMDDTIRQYAGRLDGQLVIDAANRMGGGTSMNSLASFQAQTPHVRYIRAFNTMGWENFANPNFDGIAADLLYCGPESDDQDLVEGLIRDVGMRPVRVGDSDQADLVDSLTAIWFALAIRQHHGRHLAFKVLGI